ncbi:general secretion pathway protein GspD [Haloferula helveola]|uniref:General secretion pathway protein GspD n=1 Tax=Haloferula helveola TaxID=490095 RepID=A0ABN6HA52_9BACT|nr:general secretion pathway protein GspD [Haloferula helveola]
MQRIVSILLAAIAAAAAQEPERPGAPVPPGVPVAPAPAVGQAVNPDQALQEDQIFPKLTGDELADLYRKFTGRRVTVSVAASTAEFRFIQPAPLTYGEAAQLLKKAALLEGFVFVPDANMVGHDVLVVGTGGANPKGEGLELIIDPADLPNDDRVVMYVMNLKYIKPDEIVRTFTTIIGQFGSYGSITPIPNAGAVVITEKTSLIRRLIELVEEIDVSASIATRFIKVQYADVQELSDTLNEILNTQQQSQRSAGVQRVQNNSASTTPGGVVLPGGATTPNAAAAGGASSAAEDVPIQIVPDTRTNRIFAMGRPVDIVFIEGLVREFDTKTDERNFLRRKLRFVAVADFLEIAEPALQRAFGSSESSSAGGGGGSSSGRSTGANFGNSSSNRTSSRNSTSNSRNSNFSNSSFGGSSGGSGFSGGGSSLGDPSVNTAPEARLVGRTLLVADNITNSLVVQGPPSGVEIITNLLDQIDVKAEQVMISAVFGQLALTDDFDFGLDYLRTVDPASAARGNGALPGSIRTSPGTAPLPNPFDLLTPGDFPANAGLSLYGAIGDHWNVYLNALESDTRFKVLSRPTIYTANNQKGVISAGQRIAVPTNSYQGGVNTGISTNIEYQDVLLSLEVIPLVNSDDEVTLQIALLNDEIVGSQTIEGVGDVPTIGRREVLTTVTVPDGSTIVLGGLISSTERESVTGVPLLSDIPGLGRLFSRTTTEDDRQELMIFIQPRIVKDAASLYDAQVDMDNRYDVSRDTRSFAEGPAVLPDRGSVPAGDKGQQTPVIQDNGGDDDERSARRLLGRPGSPWRRR